MPSADWFNDEDQPFSARPGSRRPASFAGMGYRLAAAGPRTRQKLIERESGFPPPGDVRYAHGAPPSAPASAPLPFSALPEDRPGWNIPPPDVTDAPIGQLSAGTRRFPVWRAAAALFACAGSGFGAVLVGQTMHLGKTTHHAKPAAAPIAGDAGNTQMAETSLDARALATTTDTRALALNAASPALRLSAQSAPPDAAFADNAVTGGGNPAFDSAHAGVDAASPNDALPRFAQSAPRNAAAEAAPPLESRLRADAGAPRPKSVIEARPPVQTASMSTPHHGRPTAAPLQTAAFSRFEFHRPGARETVAHAAPAHDTPRYTLPGWLVRPTPEQPKTLVMSPPPHNLDDTTPTQLASRETPAAATPNPAPQAEPQRVARSLPPLPQAGTRGPPIIYAEAHYPPPQREAPPPRPYYPRAYGGYYYGNPYGAYYAYPPPPPYPRESW